MQKLFFNYFGINAGTHDFKYCGRDRYESYGLQAIEKEYKCKNCGFSLFIIFNKSYNIKLNARIITPPFNTDFDLMELQKDLNKTCKQFIMQKACE